MAILCLYDLSVALVTMVSAPAGPVQPCASATLDSGAVVRLTWSDGTRERARLLAPLTASASEVRFCRYPAPTCGVPGPNPEQTRLRADVVQIEARCGGRSGRGAGIGAAIGLGLGVIAYLGAVRYDVESDDIALLMPLGALEGGAIGALIGTASDSWMVVQ